MGDYVDSINDIDAYIHHFKQSLRDPNDKTQLPTCVKILLDYCYESGSETFKNSGRVVMKKELRDGYELYERDKNVRKESNTDGHLQEVKLTAPRNDIETIYAYNDVSVKNYIIGSLLHQLYPKLHTIIYDLYRGSADFMYNCEKLHIRNFIGHGSWGDENPFSIIKKMPTIENALFSDPTMYNPYVSDFEPPAFEIIEKEFQDKFIDCLQIAKNIKEVVFMIETYDKEPTIIPNLFRPPHGWNCRLLKNMGYQIYHWVVYAPASL